MSDQKVVPGKVFIGGVPVKTKSAELREFFTQFGEVLEVEAITDRSGRGRGFGFVVFADEDVAKKVIADSSEKKILFKGRDLDLKIAKPKDQTSPKDEPKGRDRKRVFIGGLPEAKDGTNKTKKNSCSCCLSLSFLLSVSLCLFNC